MFNFRRRNRQEIAAESAEAGFLPLRQISDIREMLGISVLPNTPYRRMAIASGVNLFSANCGASTLVVGFGGIRGSLMMGTLAVLEALDSRNFDLLLLSDSRRLHFDHGIEGYAASWPELAKRADGIVKQRGYGSVVTYGTSMGGFSALRGGALLGARRAVSIGGRFPWHPAKLARGQTTAGAFEIICECRRHRDTAFYALYSEGNSDDAEHAAMLAAIAPQCRVIPMPHHKHNLAHKLYTKGRLGDFFTLIFDPGNHPDPSAIRALLD